VSTPELARYHHGALRPALLDAADVLLDEGGTGAVSLREAARRAGVSPTAAYRHFDSKEALLAAVAARGFHDFAAALDEAAHLSNDPLSARGVAYVHFALTRPGRFRLMFGPAIRDKSRHPDLLQAAENAFGRFAQFVAASGAGDRNPREAAVAAWALVHGLAQLAIDGMLPGEDPLAIARTITRKRS